MKTQLPGQLSTASEPERKHIQYVINTFGKCQVPLMKHNMLQGHHCDVEPFELNI